MLEFFQLFYLFH